MGVSTPIFQRGNLTLCALWVSANLFCQRNPYVPYITGVGSPMPFQEAELFSYTPYVVDVAKPMLLLNVFKKVWV